VTPAYYISVSDVSRATATNDLRSAVAAVLLEPRGGGRSRHYVASERLYEAAADLLGIELPAHGGPGHIVAALARDLAAG
jgi:hypothetical protein